MKVIKIKKLKNKEKVLENLIKKLKENGFNSGNWIYPTLNSYIIIDEKKTIPCYLSVKGDEAVTLWMDPDYRNKGYARFLISSLNIRYATALPSSLPFWKILGFKEISPFKLKR